MGLCWQSHLSFKYHQRWCIMYDVDSECYTATPPEPTVVPDVAFVHRCPKTLLWKRRIPWGGEGPSISWMTMRWWRFYQGIPYFLHESMGECGKPTTPSKPWKERIIGMEISPIFHWTMQWSEVSWPHDGSQTSGGSLRSIWKPMAWGPNIPKTRL